MVAAKASIQPYQWISLKETTSLIARVGHKIVVFAEGEMGIGKSSMLKSLSKLFPTHRPCYVDMTTKDVGDLLMPKFINVEGMDVCSFIPNAEFGLQFKEPLLLMWDEFSKANKTVQTQCIRALQEWQLGEHKFPEGTIQFATGNTAAEGVADSLQPHHQNRIMQVKIRKPNAKEWIEDFALDNNVHPTIIRAVGEFPQMLMSYLDFPDDPGGNPYIYDPRMAKPAFVSHRSLEKGSDVLWLASDLPQDVLIHALGGVVGPRAAADIMSIHAIYAQLPRWEEIMAAPDKAAVPASAGAQCLFVYSAIQKVEKDTVDKLMTYVQRLTKETQALFATTTIATSKAGIVTANEKFYKWAVDNNYMFDQNK